MLRLVSIMIGAFAAPVPGQHGVGRPGFVCVGNDGTGCRTESPSVTGDRRMSQRPHRLSGRSNICYHVFSYHVICLYTYGSSCTLMSQICDNYMATEPGQPPNWSMINDQ